MSDPLLNPVEQRITIFVLAALLLVISILGLWLCRQLRKANARLYRRQREETAVVLGHLDQQRAVNLTTRRSLAVC